MSEQRERNDDAFGERVGRALRRLEKFSDHFEEELVAAIRADRPVEGRLVLRRRETGAWWTTPITIRLSPLVGLAMAASIALIAVLSAPLMRQPGVPAVEPAVENVATVVHDTVNVVRFVFVGDAQSVALVGDFNEWREDATQLSAGPNRTWSVSLPLPRGRHEYAFIVDGKRWVVDPFAPTTSDEFNTASSVVTVGT